MSKDARRPIQNIVQNLGRLSNAKIGPDELPYLYQLMGNIADLIQKVEKKYGKHAKPEKRVHPRNNERPSVEQPYDM